MDKLTDIMNFFKGIELKQVIDLLIAIAVIIFFYIYFYFVFSPFLKLQLFHSSASQYSLNLSYNGFI